MCCWHILHYFVRRRTVSCMKARATMIVGRSIRERYRLESDVLTRMSISEPRPHHSGMAAAALVIIAVLLVACVGCSDEAPSGSTTTSGAATTLPETTTTLPGSPTSVAVATSETTPATLPEVPDDSSTTTVTSGPATTGATTGSTLGTTTTKRPATTTSTAPATTTTLPTTTTTAAIPPLPEGAELQVITPQGKVVPFTLDDLAALPLARMTLEGKIQEGPLLIDVLHAAGVTTFTKVIITGARGPVFVNTATADQVDGTFILDFTNHGTVKVASPVFGLEDRNAKDIYLIQVF